MQYRLKRDLGDLVEGDVVDVAQLRKAGWAPRAAVNACVVEVVPATTPADEPADEPADQPEHVEPDAADRR